MFYRNGRREHLGPCDVTGYLRSVLSRRVMRYEAMLCGGESFLRVAELTRTDALPSRAHSLQGGWSGRTLPDGEGDPRAGLRSLHFNRLWALAYLSQAETGLDRASVKDCVVRKASAAETSCLPGQ